MGYRRRRNFAVVYGTRDKRKLLGVTENPTVARAMMQRAKRRKLFRPVLLSRPIRRKK